MFCKWRGEHRGMGKGSRLQASVEHLAPGWKQFFKEEFSKGYMQNIKVFLQEELQKKKTIYPEGKNIFSAFRRADLEKVKVVILGQDPYHNPYQAHGLSFSVPPGVSKPPSLQNIFRELKTDLNISISNHGDLSCWAKQGVLLLNTVLTVERGKPGSHRGKGWERFTDAVIQKLSHSKNPLIFVLWGSFAQSKAELIASPPHKIIQSSHPSPLSASRGFLGSKPFSKINYQLEKWNRGTIDWKIPN